MSRFITTHVVNPANDKLLIEVTDEPGSGGANHCYEVSGFNPDANLSAEDWSRPFIEVLFQNGPINEVGVNGITQEVLLAIVADRLEGFQSGPYACEDNQGALECVRDAMYWLQRRTKERIERGVEGTHTV